MDQQLLIEYRCGCGKLLFKGLMLVAVVEVKCKRCGKSTLYNGSPRGAMFVSFTLLIDMSGIVVDACQAAPVALAYARAELVGSHVKDICPLFCDGNTETELRKFLDSGSPYDIKQNIFLMHDGKKLPAESYCIGMRRENALSGYRMFNWIGRVDLEAKPGVNKLSTI